MQLREMTFLEEMLAADADGDGDLGATQDELITIAGLIAANPDDTASAAARTAGLTGDERLEVIRLLRLDLNEAQVARLSPAISGSAASSSKIAIGVGLVAAVFLLGYLVRVE